MLELVKKMTQSEVLGTAEVLTCLSPWSAREHQTSSKFQKLSRRRSDQWQNTVTLWYFRGNQKVPVSWGGITVGVSPHPWTGFYRENMKAVGGHGCDLSTQNWNKQVRKRQGQTPKPKPRVFHSKKFGAFSAELRINKLEFKRGKIPFWFCGITACVGIERWEKELPDWNGSKPVHKLHVFLPALAAVTLFSILQRMAGSCSAPLTSSACCQLWNLLLIYSTLEKHLTKERNDTAAEGADFFFTLLVQSCHRELDHWPQIKWSPNNRNLIDFSFLLTCRQTSSQATRLYLN